MCVFSFTIGFLSSVVFGLFRKAIWEDPRRIAHFTREPQHAVASKLGDPNQTPNVNNPERSGYPVLRGIPAGGPPARCSPKYKET